MLFENFELLGVLQSKAKKILNNLKLPPLIMLLSNDANFNMIDCIFFKLLVYNDSTNKLASIFLSHHLYQNFIDVHSRYLRINSK